MKNIILGFCLIVFVGCANSNAYERPTVRIVGEARRVFSVVYLITL